MSPPSMQATTSINDDPNVSTPLLMHCDGIARHPHSPGDAHGMPMPFGVPPHPNYHLHSIGRLWSAGYMPRKRMLEIKSQSLREFYEAQNAQLHLFRRVAAKHPCMSVEDAQFLCELDKSLPPKSAPGASSHDSGLDVESCSPCRGHADHVQRAILASNFCNVFLLFAQLYALIASRSLSMLAVFLDAFLDVVSGLVILFTWYMKQRRRDKYRYPVGQTRLEPLGIMGMACLMTAATLSSLKESIETLVRGQHKAVFVGLTFPVAVVLSLALVTKTMLYLYCRGSTDASVLALAEDHRNDVLANSSCVVTIFLAKRLCWWIDPVGGIFISCMIIRNWFCHILQHCDNLLSKSASRELTNCITFMACNHSPDLHMVDTVRAYHVGNGIFVEVDIVLSKDISLWRAHDIGETLQIRIEQLEAVERCFVHLDYETSHSPLLEHKEV